MFSSARRLGALIALVLVAPLMVWAIPPATAAIGDVQANGTYGRDVWPGQKTTSIDVFNGDTENALATFRNLDNRIVRTMSVAPECFFDWCSFDPGLYDGYEVEWDGKNNSGAFVPAGRYTGSIRMKGDDGQPHDFSLGSLWVNHLVTRTQGGYQETWLDPAMNSLSTVGRCSSVLGPASGSPYQIRLLSMSRCNSSAGTDDWAFRASELHFWEDAAASRIISVRIGATGSPVHAGDVAGIVVDSSAGSAASPTWRRVTDLGPAGTHYGRVFTVPIGTMNRAPFNLLIQGRVVNGNRWRIQNYVASWTYRAWAR